MHNFICTDTTYMTVFVTPEMTNIDGAMHGGVLLKLLDETAYICSARYTRKRMVTLSIDRVLFRTPIEIGSVLHFHARINYTGKTSCEVGIKVFCENIKSSQLIHCNSTYITMVALENKKPCEIEPFIPKTADEKRRFEEAKLRRAARLKAKALS